MVTLLTPDFRLLGSRTEKQSVSGVLSICVWYLVTAAPENPYRAL